MNSARLNLFALPSQTALILAGILVVLGVPLLTSVIQPSLLLLPVLPLGAALLTLWDFLLAPARVQARLHAQRVPVDDAVVARLRAAAARVGVAAPPVLLTTPADLPGPFVFGSWRRRYLLLPAWLHARVLAWAQAGDNARLARFDDVLLHELAHVANGDIWRAGLARSLLKMTALLLAAHWLMSLTLPILYVYMRPQLATMLTLVPPLLWQVLPAKLAAALHNPPPLTAAGAGVFLLACSMAYLPLIGGAFVLWLRDWNLLLRVREFYSDARVAAWTQQPARVGEALAWYAMVAATRPAPALPTNQRAGWRAGWQRLRRVPALGFPSSQALRGWIIPSPQPMNEARRAALDAPHTVYGSARAIGLRAAVLTCLFQLLLASLYAPSHAGMGADLILIFGYALLAFALTPATLAAAPGIETARLAQRALGWFLLVTLGATAAMLGLALWGMIMLPGALDMTLYAAALVVPAQIEPQLQPLPYALEIALGALLSYGLIVPLALYGLLRLDQQIKRRVLTWTGAPWLAQRVRALLAGITLGIAGVLWLGAPPLLNRLALPLSFTWGWDIPARLLPALALAAGMALWGVRQQRHAGRCPHCGAAAPGPFVLGACCPTCNRPLHPWLLTDV